MKSKFKFDDYELNNIIEALIELMKKIVKLTTVSALILLMVFSFGKIISYHSESAGNQINIKELTAPSDSKGENYKRLKAQNPDIIGWIKIPGTKIDYPVMWTPDCPEKYLRTDFDGNYSMPGLPFVAADCKVSSLPNEKDCSNTLIYGHHMQDGTMFAELVMYEKEEFAKKHSIIIYDRIYADGCYKTEKFHVYGAFKTEVNTGLESEFKYYKFIDIDSQKELDTFLENIAERNLLTTNKKIEAGSKLLTMSTCSYHVADRNGRFVVIGVK